jgi:predicted PurR-regulated permease PerM
MVVGTISFTLGLFAFLSFVIVITFYFLLDYSRMEYVARVLLPDDRESRVFAIWARVDYSLGGFLRGQLLVGLIVGVLYTAALFALGMRDYAILIGFMAGFGNMIPYVGPIVGGIPTALWVLFSDRFTSGEGKMIGLGLVLLLSVSIQSIDGFFLQPRIVGQNAGLHPLLVLLALLIGSQFGLGGMIIAVPAAIMAKTVLKELWWDPLARTEEESKAALAKTEG